MATLAPHQIPTLVSLYRSTALRASVSNAALALVPSDVLNSRVSVVRADITTLAVDAIVNAANTTLLGGGGVDGAIHRAAGPDLLEECRTLHGCPIGGARITKGYNLPAKHVIHTVGPIYHRSGPAESERRLRSCYEETLKLAVKSHVRTLAFSAISTGVYGYPSLDASKVACQTVREFLQSDAGQSLERVIFVTFEPKDGDAYKVVLPEFFPPEKNSERKS